MGLRIPGRGEGPRLEGRAQLGLFGSGVKEASGQGVRLTLHTAL